MGIISGERIWSEWKKILSGRYAGQLTAKMIELGLAPYIGSKLPPVNSLHFLLHFQRRFLFLKVFKDFLDFWSCVFSLGKFSTKMKYFYWKIHIFWFKVSNTRARVTDQLMSNL